MSWPSAPRALALVVAAAAVIALAFLARRPVPEPARAAPAAAKAAPRAPADGARGVTDREIVLGMASPFTGANRDLGRAMKAGVEAAFAEVNAAGGLHGRTLRLLAVDDGYEPSRTLAAVRQLVDGEGVFALVGNVGTPTAAVAAPYCQERRVLFFGALSGGDVLRTSPPARYVFNFRPSYAEETSAAVRWLVRVKRVDPRRIAVFAQDDEFGESGWRGAALELASRGVDPRGVLRLRYRRNTADVERAVAALQARAREVDAVVSVATYKAAAAFILRTRDAGLSLVYTNVSAVDSSALAQELVSAGGGYARDVVVTQVVPLATSRWPIVARFQEALATHNPGVRPGSVALEGFVVGTLLAEALRRTGRELDADRLVTTLEGMEAVDLGLGTKLGFGPAKHQASQKVWGAVLQPDGAWRQMELD